MKSTLWMPIALLLCTSGLSGCAAALGAGAVIGADTIAEKESGGEGLF